MASQLPGDGGGEEEEGSWGLQKVTFAQCVCGKKTQQRRGSEGEKERKKERESWAGSAKRLLRTGVMEKALGGNIQYAGVSSCMQSLQ